MNPLLPWYLLVIFLAVCKRAEKRGIDRAFDKFLAEHPEVTK